MTKKFKFDWDKVPNADYWKAVSHDLEKELHNAKERDRDHGLLSLDYVYSLFSSTDSNNATLLNLIPNHEYEPELAYNVKLRTIAVDKALNMLSEIDQEIVVRYACNNESFAKISKDIPLSDKSVKHHWNKARVFLQNYLKDKIQISLKTNSEFGQANLHIYRG